MEKYVTVCGAGLAGCEAAWQIAKRGIRVRLTDMKPVKYSPAHRSPAFAELVCSNSFRSNSIENAVGLLKEEMRRLGSLVMEAADSCAVPAGSALAVDRVLFSEYVTKAIRSHPLIEVIAEETTSVDKTGERGPVIIATGPLTSDALCEFISDELGCGRLFFFDAAAPVIDAESIDMKKVFFGSRYDRSGADYLNCPMSAEVYDAFRRELAGAAEAELHDFEKGTEVFEGCIPVEVLARRGYDTLRFGPMKPVGLSNPDTGEKAYAVVQLRKENADGTMYNMVGFQTHLTFPEQRRVFRMIPGLEKAEFLRYGIMHRNTYLNSPGLLDGTYRMIKYPAVYFAGQITGVEGYVESAGSGFVAGISAYNDVCGNERFVFPRTTMLGALASFVSFNKGLGKFLPMNANFGLVEPVKSNRGKKAEIARRSLSETDKIREKILVP